MSISIQHVAEKLQGQGLAVGSGNFLAVNSGIVADDGCSIGGEANIEIKAVASLFKSEVESRQ